MESLNAGEIKLTWLNGGVIHLDGGAMFGVVPKPLWSKKYPCNDNNQIQLRTDPVLVQADGLNLLIETGIGNGKFDEKQLRNYGVTKESSVEENLLEFGLSTDDIDYILMTHMHFDHASGLTKRVGGQWKPAFENAKIITSQIEWDEVQSPNIRSRNTYWKENWEAVAHLVRPFEGEKEILDGIKMIHTGGHSNGHSIIVMENGEECIIHMADIMPTHAHANVLWVLAFDDYPMDSISQKQKWMANGLEREAWYTFYHDDYYRAIKWDKSGKRVLEEVKRKG
ncbi:MBL fold metallo-hydrolase [Bacillus sp. V5-8f]|uniref:YtnP family quorum-quenching lactonase n=1 Tax=Bacillus sp. V5-8f TaxID=2053044 RepID=UPI000C756FF3|nr:MBL fold metallo-hydrolase [Bacillus sp. V5-8f]PLT32242.1 hypothetical protein CUU64_19215 [Bacillus sp. V5-8f]